ncbi:DUF6531 domain-containing protein [Streptomyces alfalfae]|uniref:DUF6531 domain-containing protein n=1 Tax=Streptomyces alfalfae TaxID=1642299 RepID=UPI003001C26E
MDAPTARVDYSTGNLMLTATDFSLAGVGQQLTLARSYNSLDASGARSPSAGGSSTSAICRSSTTRSSSTTPPATPCASTRLRTAPSPHPRATPRSWRRTPTAPTPSPTGSPTPKAPTASTAP